MQNEKSVTRWMMAVRQGDAAAASHLWERYFPQLVQQARRRMPKMLKSTYDEEDAALSTFHLLCRKLQEGRYNNLAGRQELWQLMLTVLIRKIGRRAKYQAAAKRFESQLSHGIYSVEDLPATTAEDISQECFELIASLKDPHLEQVAMLKFQGYTNDEIAVQLNRTRRTIQRMLNLIREIWQEDLNSEPL